MTKYLSLQNLIDVKSLKGPICDAAGQAQKRNIVEIGSGNGEYLVQKAASDPETTYFGIEYEWLSAKASLRRIAQNNLQNAKIVYADAHIVFKNYLDEQTLKEVYAFFPCPWPKRHSAHHRLFNNQFIRLLNNRLIPGGTFQMITDSGDFFGWTLGECENTGFKIATGALSAAGFTRYARKWIADGSKKFHKLSLHKIEHISMPPKEDQMRAYTIDIFDPDNFHPQDILGDISVIFKEYLYDPKLKKALVRAAINEDGFIQHVWVSITQNKKGWRIMPAKGCAFVPSVGVQHMLRAVKNAAKSKPAYQNNSPAHA